MFWGNEDILNIILPQESRYWLILLLKQQEMQINADFETI